MAHLTAIIDQITRMENSLVNILLETAVKLSTLTDANIFVMVDTAGGRKWAGRKSLRDEYVRGLLKPSNKDVEVTETIASLPQEEFSMGNLMGMASGAAAKPHPATPTPSYGSGQAVFPSAHQRDSHSRDSALGRMDSEPSAAKRPRVSDQPGLPSANSASRSQPGNNNIPASPPQLRRKSPSRDQSSQDDSLSPPSSTGGASRQTVSKNLKDEFNGEENSSGDGVVIKEELGRSRGGEENRDFEDEEVEPSMEDGGGGVPWGEVALAGPSGLQGQNSDANQPVSSFLTGSARCERPSNLGDDALHYDHRADHNALTSPLQMFLVEYSPSSTPATLASESRLEENRRGATSASSVGEFCTTCGNSFASKSSLRRHFRSVHTRDYLHHCICGKGFMNKKDLEEHYQLRHKGVTHTCDNCGKKFNYSKNLTAHRKCCVGRIGWKVSGEDEQGHVSGGVP